MTPEQEAADRVQDSGTLAQHWDVLIDYDWPNHDEHIEWVTTAPEDELVDWAQTIKGS